MKVIVIGGVPGTGKSTLVKRFIVPTMRKFKEGLVEGHAACGFTVLGKYNNDSTFPGCDMLSMAVQPQVKDWLLKQDPRSTVLIEGDRLFNASFLEWCSNQPEIDLQIIVLLAPASVLQDRYEQRGSNQPEKFLRSRQTKIDNITSNMELRLCMEVFVNETLSQQEIIYQHILEQIG